MGVSIRICFCTQRADDIVCLVSLTGEDMKSHGGGGFLCPGKLFRQLVRHPVPGRLVCVKHFVAEGGTPQIKSAGKTVRAERVQMLFQNGDKSVYRIGGDMIFRVKRPDTVKSPIQNTVAVYDEQFFHKSLTFSRYWY